MIFLKITPKLGVISQHISKRVVVSALMNISPSDIFPILLLAEIYYHNCQAFLAATDTNGLKEIWQLCFKLH